MIDIKTVFFTSFHNSFEPNSFFERNLVIWSWLTSLFVIADSPVAGGITLFLWKEKKSK